MKYRLLKKGLLVGVSSLLLVACGNGGEFEMDSEPTEENIEMPDSENGNQEDETDELEENNNTDQEQEDSDVETDETQDDQSGLSEIVSMTDEERLGHHQNLAVREDRLMDQVFENLLLPGIHENTIYYEGRVGAGEQVRFEFPDAEEIENRTFVDPYVAEDGHFSIDLRENDFSAGEVITIRITGTGYPQEQTFELPVYEAQEGMEEVRVREVSENNDASEHTIDTSDTLTSIAAQYDVSPEELQNWNGILDSTEIESGMTIRVDGPNEEQAQKEEWQWDFERNLYEGYSVTVREYEDIGDGYYGVHVNEHDTGDLYYVTVDSETGDFHG